MDPEHVDDSESDSSESAGVALSLMPGITGNERMHPALQAQLLRAQQRRATSSLRGIQQGLSSSQLQTQTRTPVTPSGPMFASAAQYLPALQPSLAPRPPPQTKPVDDTNVYDPFAAAGLDLQSERHNLNAMTESSSAIESHRQLSSRQVHEEQFFVRQVQLKTILLAIAKKRGLDGVSDGVCELITFALQEHLEDIVEQLVAISRQRIDEQKDLLPREIISEPHQQIKRIQKMEEEEKRRLQQEERNRILEEARLLKESQGKDEELDSRIAERFRKLEEEEKERQKLTDINDAALLAIGGGAEFSFKKKSTPTSATSAFPDLFPGMPSFLPVSSLDIRDSANKRQLTLQDCIHYLERDYHSTKSNFLFKLYQRVGVNRPRR